MSDYPLHRCHRCGTPLSWPKEYLSQTCIKCANELEDEPRAADFMREEPHFYDDDHSAANLNHED